MDKKTIDFTKRAKAEEIGVAPITDLLSTTFKIIHVAINKGLAYDTAILTTKSGGKYRTSSDVLLEQLKNIQFWLDESDCADVEVSLKQVGNYYTF